MPVRTHAGRPVCRGVSERDRGRAIGWTCGEAVDAVELGFVAEVQLHGLVPPLEGLAFLGLSAPGRLKVSWPTGSTAAASDRHHRCVYRGRQDNDVADRVVEEILARQGPRARVEMIKFVQCRSRRVRE